MQPGAGLVAEDVGRFAAEIEVRIGRTQAREEDLRAGGVAVEMLYMR